MCGLERQEYSCTEICKKVTPTAFFGYGVSLCVCAQRFLTLLHTALYCLYTRQKRSANVKYGRSGILSRGDYKGLSGCGQRSELLVKPETMFILTLIGGILRKGVHTQCDMTFDPT